MFSERDAIRRNPDDFAEFAVKHLIFQSDRRWVAQNKRLNAILNEWAGGKSVDAFKVATMKGGRIDINSALDYVQGWYYFSRYAAYLFIETLCDLSGYEITRPTSVEYGHDRLTFASGLFRYYGMDDLAVQTKLKRSIQLDNKVVDLMVKRLQTEVKRANGDDNWVKLETSLCAYEKMFRGTRYNGYYADRMLGEIERLSKNQETQAACDEVLTARGISIPIKYLGEVNGWYGIRKNLKKYYQQHGEINQ